MHYWYYVPIQENKHVDSNSLFPTLYESGVSLSSFLITLKSILFERIYRFCYILCEIARYRKTFELTFIYLILFTYLHSARFIVIYVGDIKSIKHELVMSSVPIKCSSVKIIVCFLYTIKLGKLFDY